jgi:hypothetical protein
MLPVQKHWCACHTCPRVIHSLLACFITQHSLVRLQNRGGAPSKICKHGPLSLCLSLSCLFVFGSRSLPLDVRGLEISAHKDPWNNRKLSKPYPGKPTRNCSHLRIYNIRKHAPIAKSLITTHFLKPASALLRLSSTLMAYTCTGPLSKKESRAQRQGKAVGPGLSSIPFKQRTCDPPSNARVIPPRAATHT